jgi:hypothetical protein
MSNFQVGTYKYASTEIKGYSNSSIAKKENNDCFVRAVASATDVNYDIAHKYVADVFGRKEKQGTHFTSVTMMKLEDDGMEIGNKKVKVKVMSKKEITNTYKLKGEEIQRQKTVKSFISSYPTGTYIVGVAGHAFTVKDGVLVDNIGEEFRPTRKVQSAFRMTTPKQASNQLTLF